MKIFLVQTSLSGNVNGHFEVVSKPEITTAKQAFQYWDQFASPINIIEVEVKSNIGDVDYPDYEKDCRKTYENLKRYYNDTKMVMEQEDSSVRSGDGPYPYVPNLHGGCGYCKN